MTKNKIIYLKEIYPEVLASNYPSLDDFFKTHATLGTNDYVAGMAIPNSNEVAYNPYSEEMQNPEKRKGLLNLERSRHYMDDYGFRMRETKKEKEAYSKPEYSFYNNADPLTLVKTDVSRYLVGDTNYLKPWLKRKVNKFFKNVAFEKTGGHINYLLYFGPGGFFKKLDEKAEKLEPYAASLALGADAVGVGTAMTGVGVPAGTFIAGIGNIPSTVIDLYQTGREAYKLSNTDQGSWKNLGINSIESILDVAGLKLAKTLSDAKGLKNLNAIKDNIIAEEKAKRAHKVAEIMKKLKCSEEEAILYLTSKATNAAEASKDLAEAKRKEKDKSKKRTIYYEGGLGVIPNIYDISLYKQLLPDGSYLLPELVVTNK